MTLDEYREEVVKKVSGCRDEKFARSIINEADSVLEGNEIGRDGQIQFWRDLEADFVRVKIRADRDALTVLERQAAIALSQVIVAAQAAIAQHQAKVAAKS
jgi:hypothetical protein